MNVKPFRYAGMLGYRDIDTGETLWLGAPVGHPIEFIETTLPSPWAARDTAGATETYLADNGIYTLALTNANEAQLAGLDWADHRPLVLNQHVMIEFGFKFTVLPTGAVVAALGLCGDHNAAVNTIAESILVRADGSGALTVETDDTVNETSLVATGVTLIADQRCIARIECDDIEDVRFYIDNERVASGTTFDMSQVAALALQPVARIGKESASTAVGTLQLDYIRPWQRRAA